MNLSIVSQNLAFRDSLRIILNQIPSFRVCYEGDNLDNFLNDTIALSVDVVIIDGSTGFKEGKELSVRFRESGFAFRILLLTGTDDMPRGKMEEGSPVEVLSRDSGKGEFEQKIRSMGVKL